MRVWTGIVDFVGDSGNPATFTAQITALKASHQYPPIKRTGRGTAGPKYRLGDFSGSGSGTGRLQFQAYPYPDKPKFATGTLTQVLIYNDDNSIKCSIATPVRLTDIEYSVAKKKEDYWDVSFSYVADGVPTITWNGNQVTISQPSANDQETYVGLSRVYDPNNLLMAATQRIDCEGVTDTDGAEFAKLVAYVAAATPPINTSLTPTAATNNLKVLTANWERTDSFGGQIVIQWALANSNDNVVMPRESTTSDFGMLQDTETISITWNTAGSPPATPSAPSSTFDGETLKLVNWRDESTTNPAILVRTFTFGRNNSIDDEINSVRYGQRTEFDPHLIEGSARICKVAPTASPPSTPSPPIAGVVFDKLEERPLTSTSTIPYTFYTWVFSPLDSVGRMQLITGEIDQSTVPIADNIEIPVFNLANGTATPSGVLSNLSNTSPFYAVGQRVTLATEEVKSLANSATLTIGKFDNWGTPEGKAILSGSEVSYSAIASDQYDHIVDIQPVVANQTIELQLYNYVSNLTGGFANIAFSPTLNYPLRTVKANYWGTKGIKYEKLYSVPPAGTSLPNGSNITIQNQVGLVKASSWIGLDVSGNPSVRIVSVKTRGTGKYLTQLGKYECTGLGGPVTISLLSTGSAPPLHADKIGLVNSSAFLPSILNYPIGSTTYLGADYTIVSGVTGTNTYRVNYRFITAITANIVGLPTITGIPSSGLIESTTQPNSGTIGDYAGNVTYPSVAWAPLNIKATYPANDAFSFTSGWTQ